MAAKTWRESHWWMTCWLPVLETVDIPRLLIKRIWWCLHSWPAMTSHPNRPIVSSVACAAWAAWAIVACPPCPSKPASRSQIQIKRNIVQCGGPISSATWHQSSDVTRVDGSRISLTKPPLFCQDRKRRKDKRCWRLTNGKRRRVCS